MKLKDLLPYRSYHCNSPLTKQKVTKRLDQQIDPSFSFFGFITEHYAPYRGYVKGPKFMLNTQRSSYGIGFGVIAKGSIFEEDNNMTSVDVNITLNWMSWYVYIIVILAPIGVFIANLSQVSITNAFQALVTSALLLIPLVYFHYYFKTKMDNLRYSLESFLKGELIEV